MGNRETIGIITVLAGVLLVVGAVRGTWQQLFKDVVLGQSSSSSSGGSGSGGSHGPAIDLSPFNPTPFHGTFPVPGVGNVQYGYIVTSPNGNGTAVPQ